jgi:GNAT superfamily N-acetyltransferase
LNSFTSVAPLHGDHDTAWFDSGQPILDDWLRQHAWKNQQAGASRTFVATEIGSQTVVGFHSLAASSVQLSEAPGPVRRNMPNPIPAILLGRLAVDRKWQGRGIGASLLQDAVKRVLAAADLVGVRALLVHAMADAASGFYTKFGLIPSPLTDRTLFLPITRIQSSALSAHNSDPQP